MTVVRCPIVELRQYTLHPAGRDVLIDLFDREFIESQEALGMTILGQFRDLDRSDRFVWLRGFPDMPGRAVALQSFYSGPTWKEHGRAANATMIDCDDVLLLRPVSGTPGLPHSTVRPPNGDADPTSRILVTLHFRDHPFDDAFVDHFERRVRPVLADAGAAPIACLQTEYAKNTFPALPVREGEHAFVWLTRFENEDDLDRVWTVATSALDGPVQNLRLAPTSRSLLR